MPEFDVFFCEFLSVRAFGRELLWERFFEKAAHFISEGLLFCCKSQVHTRTDWLIIRRALYSEIVKSSGLTPHGVDAHGLERSQPHTQRY